MVCAPTDRVPRDQTGTNRSLSIHQEPWRRRPRPQPSPFAGDDEPPPKVQLSLVYRSQIGSLQRSSHRPSDCAASGHSDPVPCCKPIPDAIPGNPSIRPGRTFRFQANACGGGVKSASQRRNLPCFRAAYVLSTSSACSCIVNKSRVHPRNFGRQTIIGIRGPRLAVKNAVCPKSTVGPHGPFLWFFLIS